ncbi:hypothetical protein SEA_YABOI_193 [Streptomyces phage Yaboi]|jgi:hypothetical protein|uniref:Uncharacterized protein n=3 Tax=Streptomyces virus Yaboi TaxID=2846408 RepID=A0A385UH77_9CAUD|nr:hypothetical protein HWB86_gp128 [Streptomyces phage Yaboi]QAY08815.1 hypothetical protein SEA_GENIE2_189 [Streptomyces phage Genie2]QAY12805.1 hypothetical protein SEA_BOOMERJR_189 [Streptomyces phage BoomerJR]UVD39999.1 membrane protein [Streptomyces phage Stanimal]WNM73741.1 hypothetical protein SEA_SOLLERTIA_190 [Streptomyces phage Sollertia]AYB70991.1 hypothetical protein SEA_YABOI_193 [Streptomyces phage Yaboi]
MPNWMRLPNTRKDVSLGYRMGSAFENGYGDEGPLARGLVVGGCVFLPLLIVIALFGGAAYGLWELATWLWTMIA